MSYKDHRAVILRGLGCNVRAFPPEVQEQVQLLAAKMDLTFDEYLERAYEVLPAFFDFCQKELGLSEEYLIGPCSDEEFDDAMQRFLEKGPEGYN